MICPGEVTGVTGYAVPYRVLSRVESNCTGSYPGYQRKLYCGRGRWRVERVGSRCYSDAVSQHGHESARGEGLVIYNSHEY